MKTKLRVETCVKIVESFGGEVNEQTVKLPMPPAVLGSSPRVMCSQF